MCLLSPGGLTASYITKLPSPTLASADSLGLLIALSFITSARVSNQFFSYQTVCSSSEAGLNNSSRVSGRSVCNVPENSSLLESRSHGGWSDFSDEFELIVNESEDFVPENCVNLFEELDVNNYNGMAKRNKQVISFTVTLTSLMASRTCLKNKSAPSEEAKARKKG
ncbi:hypothetical protein F2Q68_00017993 [Brassica cretica]|uniref:Uncharacterized protein n=1 Tax=Brassica cretica TaxID=69181 RepID=A0A8S9HH64_BRACR|nr:hypothetical protein F2Q68_00017993 [Brassica cretica]